MNKIVETKYSYLQLPLEIPVMDLVFLSPKMILTSMIVCATENI